MQHIHGLGGLSQTNGNTKRHLHVGHGWRDNSPRSSGGVLRRSGGSRRDSFITPATLTFCAAPTCWKRRASICLLVLALMKTEWRGQVRARAAAVNHSRLWMSGGQSECTYGSSKSRLWTSACVARVACAAVYYISDDESNMNCMCTYMTS